MVDIGADWKVQAEIFISVISSATAPLTVSHAPGCALCNFISSKGQ
jgi:hypothetical protein